MPYPINKYHNKWTEYNGVKYQSKKEANYACELDLRLKAKDIKMWERQIPFHVAINGKKIGKYMLDFKVINNDGSVEYIDVKGMKSGVPYQMFKWKKKCVEAQYGIEIT